MKEIKNISKEIKMYTKGNGSFTVFITAMVLE